MMEFPPFCLHATFPVLDEDPVCGLDSSPCCFFDRKCEAYSPGESPEEAEKTAHLILKYLVSTGPATAQEISGILEVKDKYEKGKL